MARSRKKNVERVKYTQGNLEKAIKAVKKGNRIKDVSVLYNIPLSTLRDKLKDSTPNVKTGGPPTILTPDEENQVVFWIMHMSKCGFPVTKSQLLANVEALIKELKRENPFTDGKPGRSWYEGFLRRHPELSKRISQNLSMSRATVTETALRGWFSEVEQHLEEQGVTHIDGSRIFNCDESAFFLSPKGEKVLVKKGEKTVYNFIHNDEKECLTVLFMINATGTPAPPLLLFTYKRIPSSITASAPDSWGIGKTESGWMTGESFYEYIVNVFFPWILKNNIQLPIVLYVDGHSSHITMALSGFCREHGIILVALYPNATHIMQPLDVAFFRPLKRSWRERITEWRMKNEGRRLRKENFAPLLEESLKTLNIPEIAKSGFLTCGLHPFSPDAIKYEKLQMGKGVTQQGDASAQESSNQETSTNQETPVLDTLAQKRPGAENIGHFIEQNIDSKLLLEFKQVGCYGQWNGDPESKNLFLFWSEIQKKLPLFSTETEESQELPFNGEKNLQNEIENQSLHSQKSLLIIDRQNVKEQDEMNDNHKASIFSTSTEEVLWELNVNEQNMNTDSMESRIDIHTIPIIITEDGIILHASGSGASELLLTGSLCDQLDAAGNETESIDVGKDKENYCDQTEGLEVMSEIHDNTTKVPSTETVSCKNFSTPKSQRVRVLTPRTIQSMAEIGQSTKNSTSQGPISVVSNSPSTTDTERSTTPNNHSSTMLHIPNLVSQNPELFQFEQGEPLIRPPISQPLLSPKSGRSNSHIMTTKSLVLGASSMSSTVQNTQVLSPPAQSPEFLRSSMIPSPCVSSDKIIPNESSTPSSASSYGALANSKLFSEPKKSPSIVSPSSLSLNENLAPEQVQSCNVLKTPSSVPHVPASVSPAFQNALFWPGKPSSSKKPKKPAKEKVPSVVSSADWQNYQLLKEMEKVRKQAEIDDRKRQRSETALRKKAENEENRRKKLKAAAERKRKNEEEKEQKRLMKEARRRVKEEAIAKKNQQNVKVKVEVEENIQQPILKKIKTENVKLEEKIPELEPDFALIIKKELIESQLTHSPVKKKIL